MSQTFTQAGRIIGYRKNGAPIRQIAGGRTVPQRDRAEAIKSEIFGIRDVAVEAKRDLTDQEYARVNELKAQYDGLDAEAAVIEKAQTALDELARPTALDSTKGLDEHEIEHTYGEAFVKSREFQTFLKANPDGPGTNPFAVAARVGKMGQLFSKATIGLETGGSPASTFQNPQRVATIDYLPPEDTGILDLIGRARMTTQLIEYLQIIAVTEGAAIVAPGALKPLSDFDTALADARAYTFADGFTVTNQSLADEGFLASYLQARLPRHLRNEVQRVVLNGSGLGGEPKGILNTSGIQNQPFDTTAADFAGQLIDTFSYALERLDDADADVSAFAINSRDYWRLMRLRDEQGRYYSNGPWSQGPNTIWGVPLRKVKRLPQGVALAGEFSTITLLDREGVSVNAFNQHEDYARRNLTYVRGELRAGLAIFEPAKLCKIDLTPGACSPALGKRLKRENTTW